MKRIILGVLSGVAILCFPALAQTISQSTPLGSSVSSFGGLQFALAQGGLGNPAGTMSGYVAGNTVTLQCPGVTFTTAPVIGVTAASGGAITSSTVAGPGVTSNAIPSGSITCTQASTSGVGTGYQVAVTFGVIAAYVQPAGLTQGGGASNGNFFLNQEPGDPVSSIAGGENVFLGPKAGIGFTGASIFNTALGHNPCGNGGAGVVASSTTCIGNDAGRNIQGSASNGSNTLIGAGAGRNIAGGWNTWIGAAAGGTGSNVPGNLSGFNNVGVGYQVGVALTSGSGNVLIGAKAGSGLTNGSNNVIIGGTTGNDNCGNGNENNVFAVCASAGRILTSTGGGTPSTSATTLAGTLAVAGITTDATHTDSSVCQDSTTHQFYFGSGVAGICLGTSSMRFKDGIKPMADGLQQIMDLEPKQFRYKPGYGDGGAREQIGFLAENVAEVMPNLVGRDVDGKPLSVDYMGIAVVMTRAVQQLKAENDNLMACQASWKCRLFGWR